LFFSPRPLDSVGPKKTDFQKKIVVSSTSHDKHTQEQRRAPDRQEQRRVPVSPLKIPLPPTTNTQEQRRAPDTPPLKIMPTITATATTTDATNGAKRSKTAASSSGSIASVLAFVVTCQWLFPEELVTLSSCSTEARKICSADEVWRPWLALIHALEPAGGSVLNKIVEVSAAPFIGKSLMHAYMAATTARCKDCGDWAGFVNLLTLMPQNRCTY
jgi:hypothetical protein